MELYSPMDKQVVVKLIQCLVNCVMINLRESYQDRCIIFELFSSESIFRYINECDQDTEFVLTCSMLEIYKETLFDLLSVNRADLRIKESASRGIYVEGLSQLVQI